jgi:hypothetical protein
MVSEDSVVEHSVIEHAFVEYSSNITNPTIGQLIPPDAVPAAGR